MEKMRKIIHIDMDAFYASVEQRDDPTLRGKPIIVGGDPSRRGVVATCSYEARKYGIHSAMSSKRAYALCPHAIFIRGSQEKYRKVSTEIREIFSRYTDKIEPLALDEAFLDVTENKYEIPYATEIAKQIKKAIHEELQLTASAGISYNKFLAKIASDYQKPNGLTIIRPEQAQALLDALPIEKFFGVGKVTAKDLRRIGIRTGKDLKQLELDYLQLMFNKRGKILYDFARGIDEREVDCNRERKSIGAERTFQEDLWLKSDTMKHYIEVITEEVAERLQQSTKKAKTLTVKIKFDNFEQITRSMTIEKTISTRQQIKSYTQNILEHVDTHDRQIRLLGVTLSNLIHKDEPVFFNLSLFDE